MKAGVDAPEPALEQGGEGSGVASGSGVAGFFSAPVGRWAASHMPAGSAGGNLERAIGLPNLSEKRVVLWCCAELGTCRGDQHRLIYLEINSHKVFYGTWACAGPSGWAALSLGQQWVVSVLLGCR